MMIQINRIAITHEMKVQRIWKVQEDTSLRWKNRIDSIWDIERHNVPETSRKPIYSIHGVPFRASQHSVTLDDFVFLHDKASYVHLGTAAHFTARHINKLIFRDRSTWPHKFAVGRVKPTSFFRKFNRVSQSAELNSVLSGLNLIGETAHEQAA